MTNNLKGIARQSPFPLRLPLSLRLRLEMQAGRGNRSLNAHINLLLEMSLRDAPTVTLSDSVEEPLSRSPYGVRMPEALKARLQTAADEGKRPLNTELILRLHLAAIAFGEGGTVEPAAEELPFPPQVITAWLRLSSAIDALLSASALDLSKTAVELRAAKAAYEQLTPIGSIATLASIKVQSQKPD
ncbi:MAG: hypothetical protein E6Q69_04980 [Aquipseudomonas alcaligenes]|uniref:Arc-like DNA binding domain-containing protein n=1 Tax=Aquipseudomonas alcaligenes TaxID=43263 RepID=A0A5C7W940_AQUAC|nr:MAG: hypothetical protein E6Q69_04980 [Pseudomonas alcaligenes]